MRLEGTVPISASAEDIWALLQDPDALAALLPGCKSLDVVADDEYRGQIGAKVGPINSQYKTTFRVVEKTYPTAYRIKINGKGPGGLVDGELLISLEEETPEHTLVHYSGHANVAGKIARLGQRLIDTAAQMTARQGFRSLSRMVEDKPTLAARLRNWKSGSSETD